jgi:hypothetical protein
MASCAKMVAWRCPCLNRSPGGYEPIDRWVAAVCLKVGATSPGDLIFCGAFMYRGMNFRVKTLGLNFIVCTWQWRCSSRYPVEGIIYEIGLSPRWKLMVWLYGRIGRQQHLYIVPFLKTSLLENHLCSLGVVIDGGRCVLLRLFVHFGREGIMP